MIGNKIKKRRKELFLTLEDISKETGIDVATFSKIENDKKEVNTAEMGKICLALHIRFGYFFEN